MFILSVIHFQNTVTYSNQATYTFYSSFSAIKLFEKFSHDKIREQMQVLYKSLQQVFEINNKQAKYMWLRSPR